MPTLFRLEVIQQNSIYPDAVYPDRLGPSGKFVANYTALSCLETTGYRIKYSTALRLLELPSQAGSKVLDAGTYCK